MKLFRLMKADTNGKPLVGSGSMMLGVRPTDPQQPNKRSDVAAISDDDSVEPRAGGLSCYSDAGAIALTSKKLSLWWIESDRLPEVLEVREAGDPHFHIEPVIKMTLAGFQLLLAQTRDDWQKVEQGTEP
jgi:hypothetical protein